MIGCLDKGRVEGVLVGGVVVKRCVVALLVFLGGCSGLDRLSPVSDPLPEPSRVEPSKQVATVPMSQREKDRIVLILTLLDQADQAIKEKRLTQPRGDNAAAYYRQVLKLQPGFEEAEQGLEKLVDRYLDWSDAALQQGRLTQARDYLLQARLVEQDDPRLEQLARRIRQASAKGNGCTRLDTRQVQLRSAAMIQVLGRLADQVRTENAKVIIEAPTDAQGRWIYQQLNNRHEDFRIRANMRIEPQAGIRLLY